MEPTALNGYKATADDDALLYEALRFIGDLEVDDDGEVSPPSDDQTTQTLSHGFFSSRLAEPLTLDANTTNNPSPATSVSVSSASTPCSTGTEQSTLQNPLVWPIPAPPSTSTKPKGNPSRKKRREELLYLRAMVGDLGNQLKDLKRKAEEQQLQLQLEKQDKKDAKTSAMVLAAWEQVATRQYDQRQRTEMENIKLKRLLEEQIQIGKSLERLLLRKRPKMEGMDTAVRLDKRVRRGSLSTSWDKHKIFQELLQATDQQYPETSHVLTKVQQRIGKDINCRHVELVHDESLGMVLQTVESRLLPFKYELAVQEFWSSIPEVVNDMNPRFHTGFHDINVSDDLTKSQFRVHGSFVRESCDLMVYVTDRRYHEAERTVFVAAGFFDPIEIQDTNMDGVYMRHKGWVVFEPEKTSSPKASTKAVTRMTSYMLVIPEVFQGLEDQTRKVGTLTNFIMSALSIELESRQQAFENRLFDRSCELAAK